MRNIFVKMRSFLSKGGLSLRGNILAFFLSVSIGFSFTIHLVDDDLTQLPGRCFKPIYVVKNAAKPNLDRLAKIAVSQYDISSEFAKEVVFYANKYSKKSFPSTVDILSVVGIESSWNPLAKNGRSVGLTQITPSAWVSIIPNSSHLSVVENQIKYAAEILHINYKLTGSKEGALLAYNAGYGNWSKGRYESSYFMKFLIEREKYVRG